MAESSPTEYSTINSTLARNVSSDPTSSPVKVLTITAIAASIGTAVLLLAVTMCIVVCYRRKKSTSK